MKAIKLFKLAIILSGFLLFSCEINTLRIEGDGPVIERNVSIASFSKIENALSGNVYIAQGDVQEVKIVSHNNIIDHVKTRVSNNVWIIEMDKGSYSYDELSVYITVPNIRSVELSGSGIIAVNDFEQTNDFSARIPGSGDILLGGLEGVEKMNVSINGSGSVLCQNEFNTLKNLNIRIGGSGSFEGYKAETASCSVDIPGSGNCYVYVTETLDVNISGSGTVAYKGNPQITKDVKASGTVIPVSYGN